MVLLHGDGEGILLDGVSMQKIVGTRVYFKEGLFFEGYGHLELEVIIKDKLYQIMLKLHKTVPDTLDLKDFLRVSYLSSGEEDPRKKSIGDFWLDVSTKNALVFYWPDKKAFLDKEHPDHMASLSKSEMLTPEAVEEVFRDSGYSLKMLVTFSLFWLVGFDFGVIDERNRLTRHLRIAINESEEYRGNPLQRPWDC